MATVTLRISIVLLTALSGSAQTPQKDPRLAEITDDRMRSVLKGMAFEFTEDSKGGATAFAIHFDDHVVTLINEGKGFSLSACVAASIDPMKANQWNREHFSTRVDLYEKDCISLGAHVSFGGGSTNQMIDDFVRGFCTNVVVVTRFLANPPTGSDTIPSADRLALPIGGMAWSQAGLPAKRTPAWQGASGSNPGVLNIDRNVSLKYDPDHWKQSPSESDGRFAFSHASGGANALIISEPTAVPLDSIADIALANAQFIDAHARVVFRNRIWNKGLPYWSLKMEATVATVPMVYWGYFYVGEGGTVQVVVYTEKSRLHEYEQGFTDFLSGLTISK